MKHITELPKAAQYDYLKNPLTQELVDELIAERAYSIGHCEREHLKPIQEIDDTKSNAEWAEKLVYYASKDLHDIDQHRTNMLKAANIALAAVASIDRKLKNQ